MLGLLVAGVVSLAVGCISGACAYDMTMKSDKDRSDGVVFLIRQMMAGAWVFVTVGIVLIAVAGAIGYNEVWLKGDGILSAPEDAE